MEHMRSWQTRLETPTAVRFGGPTDQRRRGDMSIDTTGGSPTMDYKEHVRTYQGFLRLMKWAIGLVAVTLILMAIFLL
jgi:hypothetical protein